MISITIKIIMIMIFAVIKQPYTLLMLSSNQWPVLWIGFYNPHRAMTHCAKHSMQTPSCSSVRIKRPLQLWGYFMCLFISLTLFFSLPYIRSVIFQPVYWIFQSYFQFHYFLLLTVFSHCFLCSNRTSIMCCVIFQDNKLRFLEACSVGISRLAVNQEPFNSTAHNRAAKAISQATLPASACNLGTGIIWICRSTAHV